MDIRLFLIYLASVVRFLSSIRQFHSLFPWVFVLFGDGFIFFTDDFLAFLNLLAHLIHHKLHGNLVRNASEYILNTSCGFDRYAAIFSYIGCVVHHLLNNKHFHLLIFLIELLLKPQRRNPYVCVCEAALSEKFSAWNYPLFNEWCTIQPFLSFMSLA